MIHPIVFLGTKTFMGSTEGHGLVIHPIVFLETKTLIGSTEGYGLVIHPIVFFLLIFFDIIYNIMRIKGHVTAQQISIYKMVIQFQVFGNWKSYEIHM